MPHTQPSVDELARAVPEQARARESAVADELPQGPSARRRKVFAGIGGLVCIAVIGGATIITMLQRLEARNANFQPPMTSLEREQLLPPEPVLEIRPQVDGLRYGAVIQAPQPSTVDDPTSPVPSALAALPSQVPPPSPLRSPPAGPLGVAQAVHVHATAK
jgi:hypothetical protein